MKTLKDVYIKVTKQNQEELETILGIKVPNNYNVSFNFDSIYSVYMHDRSIDKQKVSLSELKRLIETIPTREEIARLKRQISAYKMNYYKVVKHSLSKEEVIDNLQKVNESIHDILEEQRDIIITQSKEINKLKEQKKVTSKIIEEKNFKISELERVKENFSQVIRYRNKEIEKLSEENERLKNKKWYQIWK